MDQTKQDRKYGRQYSAHDRLLHKLKTGIQLLVLGSLIYDLTECAKTFITRLSLDLPRSALPEQRLELPQEHEKIALMPSAFESALLNLQLFDLRREAVLRQARSWFLMEFNPETFAEFVQLVSGERNAWFRMVIGYWDMAASLVTSGAIDGDAFRAAHSEIFATFSKIQPFLSELRSASKEPDFCKYMETVVMAAADADATLARRRDAIRVAAKARIEKDSQSES
jgi:hypothetical protein